MNKYQICDMIGEGAYGIVLKCINTETKEVVAIKKFKHTEDDLVHRNTLRELKMLKALRHPNIVRLLEAFRRKKRLIMVFEFMDGNLLESLEAQPYGLDIELVKRYTFQILLGLHWCHSHGIIHRDIKPENLLLSHDGHIKLCDFGFSRRLAPDGEHTEYVATRWYRPPELLVGAPYDYAVDIWGVACIIGEMADGQPVFAGDSDLDQLHVIQKAMGPLLPAHRAYLARNSRMRHAKILPASRRNALASRYTAVLPLPFLQLMLAMLAMDPEQRPSAEECRSSHVFASFGHLVPEGQSGLCSIVLRQEMTNEAGAGTVVESSTHAKSPPSQLQVRPGPEPRTDGTPAPSPQRRPPPLDGALASVPLAAPAPAPDARIPANTGVLNAATARFALHGRDFVASSQSTPQSGSPCSTAGPGSPRPGAPTPDLESLASMSRTNLHSAEQRTPEPTPLPAPPQSYAQVVQNSKPIHGAMPSAPREPPSSRMVADQLNNNKTSNQHTPTATTLGKLPHQLGQQQNGAAKPPKREPASKSTDHRQLPEVNANERHRPAPGRGPLVPLATRPLEGLDTQAAAEFPPVSAPSGIPPAAAPVSPPTSQPSSHVFGSGPVPIQSFSSYKRMRQSQNASSIAAGTAAPSAVPGPRLSNAVSLAAPANEVQNGRLSLDGLRKPAFKPATRTALSNSHNGALAGHALEGRVLEPHAPPTRGKGSHPTEHRRSSLSRAAPLDTLDETALVEPSAGASETRAGVRVTPASFLIKQRKPRRASLEMPQQLTVPMSGAEGNAGFPDISQRPSSSSQSVAAQAALHQSKQHPQPAPQVVPESPSKSKRQGTFRRRRRSMRR